jgi:hypothetical protein
MQEKCADGTEEWLELLFSGVNPVYIVLFYPDAPVFL